MLLRKQLPLAQTNVKIYRQRLPLYTANVMSDVKDEFYGLPYSLPWKVRKLI